MWTFDEKKEYFSPEDKRFHTLKILVGAFTLPLSRKKPSPVVSLCSQLVPMAKISNKVPWHPHNSPAGAQGRGDRLSRVRFLFDERVIPCLLFPNRHGLRDCVSQCLPRCCDCRGTGFGHFGATSRSVFFFLLLRNNEIWETEPRLPEL